MPLVGHETLNKRGSGVSCAGLKNHLKKIFLQKLSLKRFCKINRVKATKIRKWNCSRNKGLEIKEVMDKRKAS